MMKQEFPETRQSLLLRLQQDSDVQSWTEFEQMYRPAVFRLARRRGLQPSDAEDLTQRVMLAIVNKLSQWEVDRQRGSFRAWLLTVTRNEVVSHFRKQLRLNHETVDENRHGVPELEEQVDWEFRRAVFRSLTRQIQSEFEPATWQCFWLTAVEQQSAQEVANALGLSLGAVYKNKSRVLKKLKNRVAQMNNSTNPEDEV